MCRSVTPGRRRPARTDSWAWETDRPRPSNDGHRPVHPVRPGCRWTAKAGSDPCPPRDEPGKVLITSGRSGNQVIFAKTLGFALGQQGIARGIQAFERGVAIGSYFDLGGHARLVGHLAQHHRLPVQVLLTITKRADRRSRPSGFSDPRRKAATERAGRRHPDCGRTSRWATMRVRSVARSRVRST